MAKLLLLATVCLVFVAAVARAAGYPIIWSVDIAQLLFAWTIFFGAHQALRHGEHVGVDLLVRRLQPHTKAILDLILWTIVAVFLGMLLYYGADLTLLNLERRLSDTRLSYGWVTPAVPVGCGLLLLSVVRKIGGLVTAVSRGTRGPASS